MGAGIRRQDYLAFPMANRAFRERDRHTPAMNKAPAPLTQRAEIRHGRKIILEYVHNFLLFLMLVHS